MQAAPTWNAFPDALERFNRLGTESQVFVLEGCFLALLLLLWACLHLRHPRTARLVGFVTLHVGGVVTNCVVLLTFWSTHHRKYIVLLLLVECIVGTFCSCTALQSLPWQKWRGIKCVNFLYVVVVLGLLQGVQIRIAYDDFVKHCEVDANTNEVPDRLQPDHLPPRFYMKAIDGVLEGATFGFYGMYLMLTKQWLHQVASLGLWHSAGIYASCTLSYLTVGFSITELDYRASVTLQKRLMHYSGTLMTHLMFRSCEVLLRLLTVLIFLAIIRKRSDFWYITVPVFLLDYLFGLFLLNCCGGRDTVHGAASLLAFPLLLANLMQFVDSPGMSRVARRISNVLLPFRTLELVGVVLLSASPSMAIHEPGYAEEEMLAWKFLFDFHTFWFVVWCVTGMIYYILYLFYVCPMRPQVDLHSTVVDDDVERLRELLSGEPRPLIDRYGFNGNTPLHLAARCGHTECMKLLIDGRADVTLRTTDRFQNTPLHLAAGLKVHQATRLLCKTPGVDGNYLNAQNSQGDTALHIATKRHNISVVTELLAEPLVSLNIKNYAGQFAAECALSTGFGFDWTSTENAIVNLHRKAAAGYRPERTSDVLEMHMRKSVRTDVPESFVETSLTASRSPTGVASERLDRSRTVGSLAGSSRGISSFMLSAGSGALSKCVQHSIQHLGQEETVATTDVSVNFEDFKEIRKLGGGAFGKVVLVQRKTTGEHFAMKLMDKVKFKAQGNEAIAMGEQLIMKSIKHPFLVSLHFAFQGESFWALVMELCPNGDLHDVLVARGLPGCSLRDCAKFGGEMILGLEHLHSLDIVFRDMKLENVIVDAEWHAKLTDFGLSRKLTDEALTMCGSFGYVAPEVLTKTGYSLAVDLYSYGVTMYMLLSGGEPSPKRPKQRMPPMKHALLRRRLTEVERNPPGDWADPKVYALSLIKDLTNKDPALRPNCSDVKIRSFFFNQLGHPVDDLFPDPHASSV